MSRTTDKPDLGPKRGGGAGGQGSTGGDAVAGRDHQTAVRDPSGGPDPRRAQLLAAAGSVLREKGYAAMTTLEVARVAGMSKRDLYRLFPSKDDLITALVEVGVQAMVQPIALGRPATRAAFYATLNQFAHAFLADMIAPERIAFYRIAIEAAPRNAHIGRIIKRSGAEATIAILTDFFKGAEAAGLCKFASVDAAIGVFFYVLLGDHLLARLLEPLPPMTPNEQGRAVGLAMLAVRALDLTERTPD